MVQTGSNQIGLADCAEYKRESRRLARTSHFDVDEEGSVIQIRVD